MTGPSSALGERLLYSACWEDLSIARRALRISKDGLVVAIGSAGDNAIGLLLDDPRRVVAIDVNPAQTALIELKVAAVRTVPGTVAEFVGGVPGAVDRDLTRLDRYARLRPQLSPEAARYWDARTDDIVAGVVHAGRFERYLAWFRRVLLPVVPGRDVVRTMLAAPDALGRHPAFFDEASATRVGSHFLARAADGLTATPIRTNPYVTFILSGSYRLPDAAPEYLRPANATLLAERADRIDVRTCSLLDALRELPDHSVDAFYLSDIFELADPAGYEESLGEIARVGRPGARLCYWNNLVERTRPESLADRLSAETDLAARLHTEDRAFIYSRLVVEEVRGTSDVRLVGEVVHAA
jgi:S-adenosylmethionine-diacylglycerol 3-amino-3-carboxypropyl transferase